MSDSQVPAGWYDDPAGDASKKRYWDGTQWTEQLMEASAFAAPAPVAADGASSAASSETGPQAAPIAAEAATVPAVAQETFQAAPAQATPQAQPATAPAQAAPQPAVNPYAPQDASAPMNQPTAQGAPAQGYPGAPTQGYPGGQIPQYIPVPQKADNSGQATAALVLGIVGLFVPWLLALLGYICGVLAIVFGVKSKNSSKKNFAIAGIVLGIVTLLFSVASSAIGVIIMSSTSYYY